MTGRHPGGTEARGEAGAPAGPSPRREPAPVGAAGAPLSVSALVARIRGALTDAFPRTVHVIGQISNLKAHSSGHLYFRLKDAQAALDAVMFRSAAGRMKFTPQDGLEVLAEGRVDVYESQGRLQLYVERMTPKGQGALELAFRQLVDKLKAEGLFDPSHKVRPPRFPRAIGVVTSPTGAAIRDIRRTLGRRWPAGRVYLVGVPVQGDGAGAEIAEAIRRLDAAAERYQIDTILLARGGGSLEDLWAFNEEVVARAIFACRTPVITGVGHEVDVTIADLVADLRAPTPTGAAELAVPEAADVRRQVMALLGRLERSVADGVRGARLALEAALRSAVFRDPAQRLRSQMQRTDELSHRLRGALLEQLGRGRGRLEPAAGRLAAVHPWRLAERAAGRVAQAAQRLAWVLGGRSKREGDRLSALVARLEGVHPRGRLALAKGRVEAARRQLEALSYRSVLSRGFSVARREDGRIVRRVADVAEGDALLTEVIDGRIASRVGGADRTAGMAPCSGTQRGAGAGRKGPPGGPSLFETT